MSMHEKALIEHAARLAAQPAMMPPQQQQQQIVMPLEGFARLVECGILTKKQAFEMAFLGKQPTEYQGQE